MNLVELPVSEELEEIPSGALPSQEGDDNEINEAKQRRGTMGRRTLTGWWLIEQVGESCFIFWYPLCRFWWRRRVRIPEGKEEKKEKATGDKWGKMNCVVRRVLNWKCHFLMTGQARSDSRAWTTRGMQIPFHSENQDAGDLAGPADGTDADTIVHKGTWGLLYKKIRL